MREFNLNTDDIKARTWVVGLTAYNSATKSDTTGIASRIKPVKLRQFSIN